MPHLVVETVAADDIGLLIPLLDPRDPLLFIRRGEGVAGIGEALRLECRARTLFTGTGRHEERRLTLVDGRVGPT